MEDGTERPDTQTEPTEYAFNRIFSQKGLENDIFNETSVRVFNKGWHTTAHRILAATLYKLGPGENVTKQYTTREVIAHLTITNQPHS